MEKLVRRPNAVILFISLSLLMMLTTGCQEIKPKAGIEAATKQSPIDTGDLLSERRGCQHQDSTEKSGKHEDFPENHVPESE